MRKGGYFVVPFVVILLIQENKMTIQELKERVRIWYSFYPINDDREALDEIMEILDNFEGK